MSQNKQSHVRMACGAKTRSGNPCREASHRETEAQRDQMAAALQAIAAYTTPGIVTPASVTAAHRKAREALGDPVRD